MIRLLLFLISPLAFAKPITSSWFTDLSGQYARVYPSVTEETANDPQTTWNHPNGGSSQPSPTYAGVSEISTTDSAFIPNRSTITHPIELDPNLAKHPKASASTTPTRRPSSPS